MDRVCLNSEAETRSFGAKLGSQLSPGSVVFLFGDLGSGKTTLVRGLLRGLGYEGEVRSPTYNLVHVYETNPPVVHADLYRVQSAEGLGLEDFAETHLILVEWPDRAFALFPPASAWRVTLEFEGDDRVATLDPPENALQ